MPTASVARLEKQASLDANDPLKQGIIIVDHKIRNLEKRKSRLESYKDLQKSGKDLNSDQLEAVAKYDAVVAHLDFARELSKQFSNLALDSAKNIKKQAKKEAQEKAQQDLNRIKEIFLIQDVLTSMGQDSIREDFLAGKASVKLTAEELQVIDDLYLELTPKREEPKPFTEMFHEPAEAMLHLIEGKNKEAFGTTYSALKIKLMDIANSGYFDTALPPATVADPEPAPPVDEFVEQIKSEEVTQQQPQQQQQQLVDQFNSRGQVPPIRTTIPPQQTPIIVHNYQQNAGIVKGAMPAAPHPAEVDRSIVAVIPSVQSSTANVQLQSQPPQPQSIETTYFTPSHLRVFKSGTIDFMQDNELDTPETTDSTQPSAIPTMTFANQSFGTSPVEANSVPPPHVTPPQSHLMDVQQYQNQTDEEKGWSSTGGNSLDLTKPENVVAPPAQQLPMVNAWGLSSTSDQQNPSNVVPNANPGVGIGSGDDDWASQTEQWHQNQNQSSHSNDGFITAGSNRGRGGRGRGGGGDRNNKGNGGGYQGNRGSSRGSNQGRGGYRGDGGFNRDREGGGGYYKDHNSGGYQNGYQNNSRGGRGGPRQGRGGPGGGGSRGRGGSGGGYRGGNNYSNPRQQ